MLRTITALRPAVNLLMILDGPEMMDSPEFKFMVCLVLSG
jgi:hypothetical protein